MQKKHNFYLFFLLLIIVAICNTSCSKKEHFQLQAGDLLFQDLDSSPLCEAIEKVTSGFNDLNFSHVGIVTILNHKTYVLEAFVNGVDTVHIDTFLTRSLTINQKPKVIVGRLKKEHLALIPKAIKSGVDLIGEKYDEEFKINNNKFYCSELIYDIFLKSNNYNSFFDLTPMTYKYNGKTLPIWIDYFYNLGIPVPENKPGINPGGISLSNKIDIIYNYAQ